MEFLRAPSGTAGAFLRPRSSGSTFASISSLFVKGGTSGGECSSNDPEPERNEAAGEEMEGRRHGMHGPDISSPSLKGQVKADLEILKSEFSSMSSDMRSLVGRNISASKVKRTLKYMVSLTQSGIHKDWIIKENEYGKGHYGVVKYAYNRWDGRPAAVKILPKRNARGQKDVTLIEREIAVMQARFCLLCRGCVLCGCGGLLP